MALCTLIKKYIALEILFFVNVFVHVCVNILFFIKTKQHVSFGLPECFSHSDFLSWISNSSRCSPKSFCTTLKCNKLYFAGFVFTLNITSKKLRITCLSAMTGDPGTGGFVLQRTGTTEKVSLPYHRLHRICGEFGPGDIMHLKIWRKTVDDNRTKAVIQYRNVILSV